MKTRNYVMLLALFMVLMCCVGAASAVSDDAMNNTISEMDSGDEAVSVSNDENTVSEIDSGDESVLANNDEQAVSVEGDDSALKADGNDEVIGQSSENEKVGSITIDGITYDDVIENQDIEDESSFFKNTFFNNCRFIDVEIECTGNYMAFNNSIIENSYIYGENIVILENNEITGYTKFYGEIVGDIYTQLKFKREITYNGTISNFTFNNYRILNGNIIIENCTINAKIQANGDNITFNKNNIFTENALLSNELHEFKYEDLNTILPYLEYYKLNYIIENITLNSPSLKVIVGNVTFKNSTINTRINNKGILILSDDTIFGEQFSLTGNGKIIINDTSRIIPFLERLNDEYFLENYTFIKAISNYGNLTLVNPKFNAKLTNYGRITLINSVFENENSAYAIQNQNGAYLEVINCEYINSTINFNSANKIANSKFINNTNMNWYIAEGLVENSTFINNNKDSSMIPYGQNYGPSGGALTIEKGIVKNCTFINNGIVNSNDQAGGGASGGAIYSKTSLIVDNCTFEDNYAISNSIWIEYQGGGAIYARELTVTNSKFINNYVESPHGTVTNGSYYYTIFEDGMGGAILVAKTANTPGNVNITNNTFKGNKASIDGSAVFIQVFNPSSIITITGNNFTDNSEGKDTIYLRNYIERIPGDGNNYVEYINATTEINSNNYLNNTMNFKSFELTGPEDIYPGETAEIKLDIELEHPEFYDADIMERCDYTWYMNGQLVTNKETEMTVIVNGNYLAYVTPSISNKRSDILSIMPIILTDIIITPENINGYVFEGQLIVNSKSNLIFKGDFKNLGQILNKKENIAFDGTDATFENTSFVIIANKNTFTNMRITNTDTSSYIITLNGDKNKVINSTLTQYNNEGKTAAIYSDNGNNNLISGNTINVWGPSLSITYEGGANTANTQGILCVGGENNTIEYNTITVKNSTDSELAQFSTMEGITAPSGTNTIITKNTVYTTGGRFNYGINTLTNVINNKITDNNITVVGYRYADGIQVGDGAINNIISGNSIQLTCLNQTPVDEAAISYGIIITSQGGLVSDNNTVCENNININGIVNYGMEVYTATNTQIINNNITMTGAKSMGIGFAHSPNATVSGNTIMTSDDSTIPINSVTEEIQPASVGIKIQQESDNIEITDNIIKTDDKAKTDYSIISSDENTVITGNSLMTSTGYGDETVQATSSATIENDPINTVTQMDDVSGIANTDVTLTANVTTEFGDDVNGGVVEFRDAGGNLIAQANVIDGVAKTTKMFTDAIATNITATYRPASAGLASSKATAKLKIEKIARIELSDLVVENLATSYIAVLVDDADAGIAGAVLTLSVNGETYNATTDANGVATFDIALTKGTYTAEVSFGGNDEFGQINATGTITVMDKASIEITTIYGDAKVAAILKDSTGKGIANATVFYTINNGERLNVTTDENGEFTIQAENNCNATMSFEGDALTTSAEKMIALTNIAPAAKGIVIEAKNANHVAVDIGAKEKGKMYYFTVKDIDGNAVANKTVKVSFNGAVYTVTTDATGKAGITISAAAAKTYNLNVFFMGDDDYKGASAVAKIKVAKKVTSIKPAKATYVFKANAKSKIVQATLKTSNKYLKAGKKVTITIKGKTYTAKTLSKGVIKLNIKGLNKKGTYSAKIKFAGDSTYKPVFSKFIKIVIK